MRTSRTYRAEVDGDPDIELREWEPHRPEDFPASQRPTIERLNAFDAAFFSGRIPRRCYRGHGPDYDPQQVEIIIFPDDEEFRAAVAAAMPSGSYRIDVSDLRNIAT